MSEYWRLQPFFDFNHSTFQCFQKNENAPDEKTFPSSPLGNASDAETVTLPKSPPVSPLVKEREMEAYNCSEQLLTMSTHTYSQSSSSQSPSSLPSSRSVASPRPLTPSSTDSHEKSPSPHREKEDLDRSPPKAPTTTSECEPEMETETVNEIAPPSVKSNLNGASEIDVVAEEKEDCSDPASEDKLNNGDSSDIVLQKPTEMPAVTSEVSNRSVPSDYWVPRS